MRRFPRGIIALPETLQWLAEHDTLQSTDLETQVDMFDNYHSTPLPSSSSSSSGLAASLFPADAQIGRRSRQRTSLGLIDVARVRLSQDFKALVRSSSTSARARIAIPSQTESLDDPRYVYPDYASSPHTLDSDLDIEHMSMTSPLEQHPGRSLGTRLADFLNRSRSRSRSTKRRSRSLDDLYLAGNTPLPLHTNHTHLDDGLLPPLTPAAIPKPSTRSPSRPLSAGSPTTAQPRLQRPPHSAKAPAPPSQYRPRADVIPVQQTQSVGRSTKKSHLFSIGLSRVGKSSFGESSAVSKSRPATPPAGSDRGRWSSRFRPTSGSNAQHSHDLPKVLIPRPADRKTPPNSIDLSSPPRTPRVRPPPVVLNSPPRPHENHAYRAVDLRTRYGSEDSSMGGRCSPLCGLPSSKLTSGMLDKGKQREKARAVREPDPERMRTRGKERETAVAVRPNRTLGSPVRHEHESRLARPAMLDRAASGSGSASGRRTADPLANINMQRTKHGSFDFERPVSATPHGTNVTPARRSIGAGDSGARTRPLPLALAPSNVKVKAKPRVALDIGSTLVRRETASSNATSAQAHHHSRRTNNSSNSEPDPASPISSHSGQSSGMTSSWGRGSGKRMMRASHGPFKFEPAVPPIPGSPADERKNPAFKGPSSLLPSPLGKSPTPPPRMAVKGRSLELGIGLSWAPSKVKEEAVLQLGGTGRATAGNSVGTKARARWRGGEADAGVASDVAEAFRNALGEAAYATFKNYVHRFDAQAIPLDGPFGLVLHVRRLLESAPGLSERERQALLDRFVRVVREHR